MLESQKKMSTAELRKFALVTSGMLILFFDIIIPWIWDFSPPIWPLGISGILIVLAGLAPSLLEPIYLVWMKFAEALGWINTRIILSLIFFLLFLPFGIVLRIFKDPMRRKLDDSIESYRVESSPPKKENMERPF